MLSSREIAESVEDLAWAQWAALSSGGPAGEWPRNVIIDPEVLVCMTAWSTDDSSRVRAAAIDWIKSNAGFLSWSRRKTLVRDLDSTTLQALDAIWPQRPEPLAGTAPRARVRRVALPTLSGRGDLIVLRARALFGVGVRAEVLRVMTLFPHRQWQVSRLAATVGYAKRSVAEALGMLEHAGVASAVTQGNALSYRLKTKGGEISQILGPLPDTPPPDWAAIMRIQLGLWAIAHLHEQHADRAVAEVESSAVRERIHIDLIGEWFAAASIDRVVPNNGYASWLEYWVERVTDPRSFQSRSG